MVLQEVYKPFQRSEEVQGYDLAPPDRSKNLHLPSKQIKTLYIILNNNSNNESLIYFSNLISIIELIAKNNL